jgi:hypothetical protein
VEKSYFSSRSGGTPIQLAVNKNAQPNTNAKMEVDGISIRPCGPEASFRENS